jgi:hypothetical protein
MLEVAEAGAAVILLDRDAVQSEGSHLGPQIARKSVALVDLVGARSDPRLGEVAHRLPDGLGGLAEIEVELAGGVQDHGQFSHLIEVEAMLCCLQEATAVTLSAEDV